MANSISVLPAPLLNDSSFKKLHSTESKPFLPSNRPGDQRIISYEKEVKLLAVEASSFIVGLPGVSTTTVYEGNFQAVVSFLSERVLQVVRLNPWLVGHLVKKDERLYLRYNETITANDSSLFFNVIDDTTTSAHLDDAYSPRELNPALALLLDAYLVPQGTALIGVCPAPALFKVSLLKMHANRFMLVTSISHIIADGSTYYALHCMLGKGSLPHAQPRALCVERVRQLKPKVDALIGGNNKMMESMSWLTSPGSLLRIISLFVAGPRQRYFMNIVPTSWATQQKKKAVIAATDAGIKTVSYVSTNDCIMSALANVNRDKVVLMAVNLRGRVPGLEIEKDLAGNYEQALPFLFEDVDYAWKVREAISSSHLCRISKKSLPGFCESSSWNCGVSLVTNWATFYHDVEFPKASLIRHMPAPPLDTSKVPMCVYIIFSPREGELEFCACVRNSNVTSKSLTEAFLAPYEAPKL